MAGEAFEFTPGGIVPLGSGPQPIAAGSIGPGIAAGGAALQVAQEQAVAATLPPAHAPAVASALPLRSTSPLNRRQWSRELKSRLKVVRAELRRLRSLADEEAELLRLIAAAKQPPAKVRSVDFSRGRTG